MTEFKTLEGRQQTQLDTLIKRVPVLTTFVLHRNLISGGEVLIPSQPQTRINNTGFCFEMSQAHACALSVCVYSLTIPQKPFFAQLAPCIRVPCKHVRVSMSYLVSMSLLYLVRMSL